MRATKRPDLTRKCYTVAHKIGICHFIRRVGAVSPVIVTVLAIQCLWLWFDATVTSKKRFRPKRPPIKVTESMPTCPFYFDPRTGQPIPYDGPSRVFPKFVDGSTNRKYPCGELMGYTPKDFKSRTLIDEGLMYIKEMETGSTILAGIGARIAHRQRSKMIPSAPTNTSCTVRLMPTKARKYAGRNRDKSFLWTFVREPVDRLIHKYYHYAIYRRSWAKKMTSRSESKAAAAEAETTTTAAAKLSTGAISSLILSHQSSRPPPAVPADITNDMINYILNMENVDYGYYIKSLSVPNDVLGFGINTYRTDLYQKYTQDLLDAYDFIGVVERWDESLAVLQLLLGLDTADVMYLPRPKAAVPFNAMSASEPSKTSTNSGSHVAGTAAAGSSSTTGAADSPFASETDYYEHWNRQCRPIPTATVYKEMKDWFYSDEFEAYTEADVLVYKAVNRSLDLTIDSLGREKVEKAVRDLQIANSLAQEQCSHVRFPCSSDGKVQTETDCLIPDMGIGCGYKCIDEVSKTLS